MFYNIHTDGGLKGGQVFKNIHDNDFEDIISLLVDVDYLSAKYNKIRTGYDLTIVQSDIESEDIVEDFEDRFQKYSISNGYKFSFQKYTKITNLKGEEVSAVIFFYKFNIFERKQVSFDVVEKNNKKYMF